MKNRELTTIALVSLMVFLVFSVASVSAEYPAGMVSYWNFDEGSGTTAFDSVGTNNGILFGPVWASGQVDGALSFGGSDYVAIPSTVALNPEHITLEAWVYPTSKGYYRSMISKPPTVGFAYPWGVYGLSLYGYTSRPSFMVAINDIPNGVTADEEIPLSEWTHLAGTYNGETLSLYVNGILVKHVIIVGGPIDSSTKPVYIGKPLGNNYYYGMLDEVAIYNRALTPEEIQQHYQNGLNGLGYEELVVLATIDIDPNTINLKGNGKWVTTYIEFPEGHNVSNISIGTIMLNNLVSVESQPTEIGDYDDDGIIDLMVKFDRSALQEILEVGDEVGLTVAGELTNGKPFDGSDTISVIV